MYKRFDPVAGTLLVAVSFGLVTGLATAVHNLKVRNREISILHHDLEVATPDHPTVSHSTRPIQHFPWPGAADTTQEREKALNISDK